jgi:hypothetical protein
VTVGILALHYVTSDPTENQLGMKQPDSRKGSRPTSTVHSRASYMLPSSVAPRATTETRVCAGDHDADQDVITVPNRISVRKTYDVQFEEAYLPSINTTSIDRKHLAEAVEEVGPLDQC